MPRTTRSARAPPAGVLSTMPIGLSPAREHSRDYVDRRRPGQRDARSSNSTRWPLDRGARPHSLDRMQFLTLHDLNLGLANLLDKRHAALVSTNAGKTYEPMLARKRDHVAALPASILGKPQAE